MHILKLSLCSIASLMLWQLSLWRVSLAPILVIFVGSMYSSLKSHDPLLGSWCLLVVLNQGILSTET